MSAYTVQYADGARSALLKLTDARRRDVTSSIEGTVGRDPYGSGSSAVRGDRDRREATISGAFIRYEVSSGVLIVTVLQIVAPFG